MHSRTLFPRAPERFYAAANQILPCWGHEHANNTVRRNIVTLRRWDDRLPVSEPVLLPDLPQPTPPEQTMPGNLTKKQEDKSGLLMDMDEEEKRLLQDEEDYRFYDVPVGPRLPPPDAAD